MLHLGIDVVILSVFAVLLTVSSVVISYVCCFSKERGDATVYATLVTSMLMVVIYTVMAEVLDFICGL